MSSVATNVLGPEVVPALQLLTVLLGAPLVSGVFAHVEARGFSILSPTWPWIAMTRVVEPLEAYPSRPLRSGTLRIARDTKRLPSGNLNAYVAHMFVVLLAVLAVSAALHQDTGAERDDSKGPTMARRRSDASRSALS